ncbi:MAG TPA: helix-turn-helix domain-containing protein [Longimicrobiaceae bacterium]
MADVIDLGTDTTCEAMRRRLKGVGSRRVSNFVECEILPRLPVQEALIVRAAMHAALKGGRTGEIGRGLHASPRSVDRWCTEAGLPTPRRLLIWFRILAAADLLDDPGRTTESVALACGYSSKHALNRAFRQLVDMTPSRARNGTGFAEASAAFVSELKRGAAERGELSPDIGKRWISTVEASTGGHESSPPRTATTAVLETDTAA